ncbi:MAG: hypothetical protein AAFR76_12490 [Planctomycetota bacterium]
MQRTHIVTGLSASVGTLTIAAAFGFAQPDGLEPPTGPVVDTQPSLASIDTKVDGVLLGQSSSSTTEGPWDSFFQPVNSDQLSSVELTSGRTLVHKVIVYGSYSTVFDGAGSVSTSGQNPSANAVGQVTAIGSSNSSITNEVTLNIVVENGLHVAWDKQSTLGSTVQVLYKELP